jgi:hypothetical protein
MKDVRAILMNEEAGFVPSVKCIPADMRPAVNQKDSLVSNARKSLG